MQRQSQSLALKIAELAGLQHGVIARWQLLALGLGEGAIDHRVRTGRLHPIHRGVYAVGHPRLGPLGRFIAAVLACGEGALLSHRSAGHMWNLKTGGSRIEVTTESSGRSGPERVLLHETRLIHPDDRARLDGIPVTSLARTLVDLASVLDATRTARAFEQAERNRQLDVTSLTAACDRAPTKRGVGVLRALIAERRTPADTRSALEQEFIERLRAAGLPLPVCNVMVESYMVDALWPEHRLIVELDGFAFHDRTRRDFDNQRIRRNHLQLAGYTVAELTAAQMPDAAEIVAGYLRICAARTA